MDSIKGKEVVLLRDNIVRIFSPNIICNTVNIYDGLAIQGELYHSYSNEPYKYRDIFDMILKIEEFYDKIWFPMSSTETRSFYKKKIFQNRREVMSMIQDDDLFNKRGDKGTFIIQVQYRQNSSWQGKIVWVEQNKTQHFRSALELIKLMDGALNEGITSKNSLREDELLSG